MSDIRGELRRAREAEEWEAKEAELREALDERDAARASIPSTKTLADRDARIAHLEGLIEDAEDGGTLVDRYEGERSACPWCEKSDHTPPTSCPAFDGPGSVRK